MRYNIGDLVLIILDNIERIGLVIDDRSVLDVTKTIYDYKLLICGIERPQWVFHEEIQSKYET